MTVHILYLIFHLAPTRKNLSRAGFYLFIEVNK